MQWTCTVVHGNKWLFRRGLGQVLQSHRRIKRWTRSKIKENQMQKRRISKQMEYKNKEKISRNLPARSCAKTSDFRSRINTRAWGSFNSFPFLSFFLVVCASFCYTLSSPTVRGVMQQRVGVRCPSLSASIVSGHARAPSLTRIGYQILVFHRNVMWKW